MLKGHTLLNKPAAFSGFSWIPGVKGLSYFLTYKAPYNIFLFISPIKEICRVRRIPSILFLIHPNYLINFKPMFLFYTPWNINKLPQLTFTCSKSTIEILEKKCEICSKLTIKAPQRHPYSGFSGPYCPTFGLNTERYWFSNVFLADIPEKNRRGVFRKLLNIYSGTFCEKVNEWNAQFSWKAPSQMFQSILNTAMSS